MTFMPLSLSTVKKRKRGMAMQKENKRDSCSYKSRAWWKKREKKDSHALSQKFQRRRKRYIKRSRPSFHYHHHSYICTFLIIDCINCSLFGSGFWLCKTSDTSMLFLFSIPSSTNSYIRDRVKKRQHHCLGEDPYKFWVTQGRITWGV